MVDKVISSGSEDPVGPMLFAPTIIKPKAGEVITPGFTIEASTPVAATKWNLQIFDSRGMIKDLVVDAYVGKPFSYDVPRELIPSCEGFYFRIDYYDWPFWSKWAWSGDKVMGLDEPYFRSASGYIPTNKPLIKAGGFPGAIVRLYEAGSGAIVHGEGEVGADGLVDIQVVVPLRSGHFPMTANQTKNGMTSDWMPQRDFIVP